MRVRSLAVAVVAACALVPITGVPSQAGSASEPIVEAISEGVWKSGATRRPRVRTTVSTALRTGDHQDRVLALTNLERTRRGLRPLAPSACADGFADRWAATLVARDALSHQPMGPILSSCRARRVGENVASGHRTAEQVVQAWMDSPGHRANLLAPAFSHLGVGAAATGGGRWYSVQVFLTL